MPGRDRYRRKNASGAASISCSGNGAGCVRKNQWKYASGELAGDGAVGRENVENGRVGYATWLFSGKAPCDASATIVTHDSEPIKPQRPHHLDLIQQHGALRVAAMILAIGGLLLKP